MPRDSLIVTDDNTRCGKTSERPEADRARSPTVVLTPGEKAVIRGFAPDPDFWNTIGSDDAPVAVIRPAVKEGRVSVKPAATLNVTPPEPTPSVFRSAIAAARLG